MLCALAFYLKKLKSTQYFHVDGLVFNLMAALPGVHAAVLSTRQGIPNLVYFELKKSCSNIHNDQRCVLMALFAKSIVIFWTGKSRPITFIRWPVHQTAFHVTGAQRLTAAAISLFKMINNTNIAVGKYLVSPLAKMQAQGQYAASVSIRSGRGSGTHDLVLRFNGMFDSAAAAVHYATEHALGWIKDRNHAACV